MSYQLLSETTPKARKDYVCIWCGEAIPKATVHEYKVGKYDGELQCDRFHPECSKASTKHFREEGAEEFIPYDFNRGSTEPK